MAPRKQPIIRRSIVIFAAAGLAIAVIVFVTADTGGRHHITTGAISNTSYRIALYYWHNKHHLPPNLAALPILEEHDNRTTDEWDRPLIYSIDSPDSFTLSSLGRDGTAGGTGDDADIVGKFRIADGDVQSVP